MNPLTISDLHEEFGRTYGRPPSVIARAPGRIEFIGNHTDYNGGAVLGAAINRYVWVAVGPNPAGIRLASATESARLKFSHVPENRLTEDEAWGNYPLGVWRSLRDFEVPQPPHFDLLTMSDLPPGAGLSSSAALELSTALALLGLAGGRIELARLAALGRHAENKYVGVPCGILDQGSSAFGRAGDLVHIDCRGPVFSRVPLAPAAQFWVFNTREKHALIDGLYAQRHRECEEAAKVLGVAWLTDLSPSQLDQSEKTLPAVLRRRARHVVDEQARVGDTVAALRQGDLVTVGRLLVASHRSSQHLFENSTPALDRLVDLLTSHPAVFGARLTGGGFGGAVMALTTPDFSAADAIEIVRQATKPSEPPPAFFHLETADGAREMWRG